jgi:hypothetical protein
MKKLFTGFIFTPIFLSAQNVGIGTTNPLARLHVTDSNVIFSAPTLFAEPVNFTLPINGPGTRFMWMPQKGAIRAGLMQLDRWDADSIGFASAAFGGNTLALGSESFAMGTGSRAYGFDAMAVGNGGRALGNYSVSLGINNYAVGNASVALNGGNTANGINSMATGNGTYSNGDYSFATGVGTIANSYGSYALGRFNDTVVTGSRTSWVQTDPLLYIGNGTVSNARHNTFVLYKNGNIISKNTEALLISNGTYDVPVTGSGTRMMWLPQRSAFRLGTVLDGRWDNLGAWSFAAGYNTNAGESATAIGLACEATRAGAFAAGSDAKAFGSGAVSAGLGSIANAYASFAAGRYNDYFVSSSQTTWVATDPLFTLGNGSSDVLRSNALVVLKNGNTTINGNTVVNGTSSLNGNTSITGTATHNGTTVLDGFTQVQGLNLFEFGAGVAGKEVNAGKIGYNAFGQNALTFVGGGTNATNRAVYFYAEGGATFNGPATVGSNLSVNGEVNRTTTGAANMVPVCYGTVDGTTVTPTILGGSGNFTVSKIATGSYQIVVTGETFSETNHTAIATILRSSLTGGTFAWTGVNVSNNVFVNTGNATDQKFHFVIYKP